jgi:hypothetical protein
MAPVPTRPGDSPLSLWTTREGVVWLARGALALCATCERAPVPTNRRTQACCSIALRQVLVSDVGFATDALSLGNRVGAVLLDGAACALSRANVIGFELVTFRSRRSARASSPPRTRRSRRREAPRRPRSRQTPPHANRTARRLPLVRSDGDPRCLDLRGSDRGRGDLAVCPGRRRVTGVGVTSSRSPSCRFRGPLRRR